MVTTVAAALAQVKDDLPPMIERHVMEYLAQHPDWDWRQRLLDPLTTTLLFTTQVLHGNTAITHLPHLSGMNFTATAYCNARARLPLALLQAVSDGITGELLPQSDDCRWRGHRMWNGDASSFSMPDTPELQAHFGHPSAQRPGCSFPVSTMLTTCNAAGFITQAKALPLRTHEASQIDQLHDSLEPGDVLVYDRAACSYVHLCLILQRNLHAIFRMHQKRIVSFHPRRKHAGQCDKKKRVGKPKSQWLCRLGKSDQLVRWFKPRTKPRWMTQEAYDALPSELVVRELRYRVRRRGFRTRTITLVTTLLDPEKYPAKELAEQYLGRWEIEINFRHLKTTMGMDVLKCKTVEGVLKELAVYVLVYNLVRLVMLRAAGRQKVPPDRISFVDALRWLRDARDSDDPEAMLDLIVNPKRPGRVEPRVVKRRPKKYPLMTRPRQELRQALITERLAA
jgi:hypothetical protein